MSSGVVRESSGAATGSVALLKAVDVQRMLGVSRAWVYQAASDGRLPAVRLGSPDGPLRFDPRDVTSWLDAARGASGR